MRSKGFVASILLGLLLVPVGASVQRAQLKNLERLELCVYWKLGPETTVATLLRDILAVAPSFQRLAPGETSRIDLADGQKLAIVFVPWTTVLDVRTRVRGTLLSEDELVSGRQVGLSSSGLWAGHPASRLEAALSDWCLSVPRFALDANPSEWVNIPVTARWQTPSAQPDQPETLRITVADQALWMQAHFSSTSVSETTSWVLRGQGVFWELYPRGGEVRVWQFNDDGSAGRAVGARVVVGSELEVWIPLERLDERSRELLSQGRWQLRLVEGREKPDNLLLLDVRMGDLP